MGHRKHELRHPLRVWNAHLAIDLGGQSLSWASPRAGLRPHGSRMLSEDGRHVPNLPELAGVGLSGARAAQGDTHGDLPSHGQVAHTK